jgi:hypothetical protein
MSVPSGPPHGDNAAVPSKIKSAINRSYTAICTVAVGVWDFGVRYLNAFVSFFGILGTISIAALLIAGFALYWSWQHEDLRPIVSSVAAGLGVGLAAIAGFIETKADKSARWILATAAGGFTILFAWFTAADLTNQLKDKTEITASQADRLRFLSADIVYYLSRLKSSQPDEYHRVLADIGDRLRSRFRDEISKHRPPFRSIEFDPSRDVIEIIEAMEGKERNGHSVVISGEIESALDHPDVGTSRFNRYLSIESERTRNAALGEGQCWNSEGICRERTAWVFHQLARGLLKIGRNLKAAGRPEAEYQPKLAEGLKHACSAVQLFPPNGFTTQVPSTRVVEKALWDELGKGPAKTPEPRTCLGLQS